MIALDYNFAFIHINKNGGSSFEKILRPFETLPQIIGDHAPAYLLQHRLDPAAFEKLESFAIVRNPFDRFVSSYEYRRQHLSPETAPDDSIPMEMSFDKFISDWTIHRPNNREVGPQSWFLTDQASGEKLIIKHIHKFEDGLASLLEKMIDLCGFPEDLRLPDRKINQTTRKPWQEYFAGKPELIRIVGERCQADERFGYDLNPQL